MLDRVVRIIRADGIRGIGRAVFQYLASPKAACHQSQRRLFAAKTGLEIGGPSSVFGRRGFFPVYPLAARIDNVNWSSATVWGRADQVFRFDRFKPPGDQIIAEAAELGMRPSSSYDFVLASHILEHCANPLRALAEWKRLLRHQGSLVVVLPHKEGTFDHRRPVTTLAHLEEDFEAGIGEDDLTHLPEILALHDLDRDPAAGGPEAFARRSRENFANRCLHHHVFDTRLAIEILGSAGFQLLTVETMTPFHIFLLARRLADSIEPDNSAYLESHAAHFVRSPFGADRAISL